MKLSWPTYLLDRTTLEGSHTLEVYRGQGG